MNTIGKRYFEVNISTTNDEGKKFDVHLDVEPPKLKVLKKIAALSKTKNAAAMDDLTEAVRLILNKNKTGYIVSADVIDELDLDQMVELITEYFKWLGEARKSPN